MESAEKPMLKNLERGLRLPATIASAMTAQAQSNPPAKPIQVSGVGSFLYEQKICLYGCLPLEPYAPIGLEKFQHGEEYNSGS